ncbi:MAG TPA: DUF6538 domain-containing protein [Tianweitania sediminis]|jgi:hypothetical protein|nr:DUF6538 domain-containing protein [Tianweitania sediminis]
MPALPERLMIRGKTFYCRVCVPAEVAPSFGRKLVATSLRTQDLRTAKQRLARATVDLENQFEAIRTAKTREAMSHDAGGYHQQALVQIVRQFGVEVEDQAFSERVRIFEVATADPRRLCRG